MAEDIFLQILI